MTWLTRAKSNLAYTVERDLQRSAAVHEALVWIGPSAERQLVRLISVLYHGTWYRYLTMNHKRPTLQRHQATKDTKTSKTLSAASCLGVFVVKSLLAVSESVS